jgi:7-cyano-7-deazaguanine synthase in queuosine biosynthesis
VSLDVNDIGWPLLREVPTQFTDLIEIATYVYCADQAVTRGGEGVENAGAEWRRRFHFRIPVRHPDLWSDANLQKSLVSTLGFLSDDEFVFEFTKLDSAPSGDKYLFAQQVNIEEVVLFSGGLDSLAGAIQEAVVGKRRVALVTHKATSKLEKRHRRLTELLARHAEHPPLHMAVNINKDKGLGREYTQRTRSFLYASLAATVAQMLGLSRIRFYENGVVSLNLPPTGQVVGAKATRTTHPQVLQGFARILSAVAGRPFTVENPLLWHTKSEVVELIAKAGCSELIRFSTSCTHTWEMTRLHPHCGGCSQCIDRRFAVLAAGAREDEPESMYKIDLLVGERDEGEPRTMVAAYVETASQVTRMSPVEFFSRFGEASRVLRHLDGSADSTGLRVFELHQRHAKQVTKVVDDAVAAHAKELRERTLPASCLLRLVCDASTATGPAASGAAATTVTETSDDLPTPGRNSFRRKGRAWQVRFAGATDFIVLPSKGAAYLHILLSNPGAAVSAARLASTVAGTREEYMLGDAGVASDQEAMSAYRARYEELKEELQTARQDDDPARQARIRTDMSDLAAQIKRDRGFGGRLRKEADNRDRVRKAVGIAIRRVIEEIAQSDKALAAHLGPPTLKRGFNPCYAPSAPVEWSTS